MKSWALKSPAMKHLAAAGIIGTATLVTVVDSLRWLKVIHPDWTIASAAALTLASRHGLQVYSLEPNAQMGPLALIFALLPRAVYIVVIAALLGPCLALVTPPPEQSRGGPVRRLLLLSLGSALVIVPWSQLAWKGHADDALVLLGTSIALAGFSRAPWARGRHLILLGVIIAIAGKPTGVVLLPLAATSLADAILVGVAVFTIWAPFALADLPAFLHAGRGVMKVAHGSLPSLMGTPVGAPPPLWARPVQLVGGVLVSVGGLLRRRADLGILAAFALRAIIEPNPAPAYSIPLIVVSMAVDMRLGWPVFLFLSSLSFWLATAVLQGAPGHVRIVTLLAILAGCIYCWLGMNQFSPRMDGGVLAKPSSPAQSRKPAAT